MMAKTIRRVCFCVSKETSNQLAQMCEEYGENQSQVIKRALTLLHYITFNKNEAKNESDSTL